jgi:hypothetical protein
MSPWLEILINGTKGGKKTLRLPCRFEVAHFLLAQSRRLVRIFRPIVQPFVLSVLNSR